jgi:hypothetical protein
MKTRAVFIVADNAANVRLKRNIPDTGSFEVNSAADADEAKALLGSWQHNGFLPLVLSTWGRLQREAGCEDSFNRLLSIVGVRLTNRLRSNTK